MHTIAFINHKGGVGKTTLCAHLGYALAHLHGKRVLLVDFDPQSNLTLLRCADFPPLTLAEVFRDGVSVREALLTDAYPHLLAADLSLDEDDIAAILTNEGYTRLARLLEEVSGEYDYVLIDCPPSRGVFSKNALIASTDIALVLNPEYFSMRGVVSMVNFIERMQELNPYLRFSTVLLSHFYRAGICEEAREAIAGAFPHQYLPHPIRRAVAVVNAAASNRTVFEMKEQSDVTNDFKRLAQLFIDQYEPNIATDDNDAHQQRTSPNKRQKGVSA
jgi:chromosome partitioning protein